jgi:hypothetical protein
MELLWVTLNVNGLDLPLFFEEDLGIDRRHEPTKLVPLEPTRFTRVGRIVLMHARTGQLSDI